MQPHLPFYGQLTQLIQSPAPESPSIPQLYGGSCGMILGLFLIQKSHINKFRELSSMFVNWKRYGPEESFVHWRLWTWLKILYNEPGKEATIATVRKIIKVGPIAWLSAAPFGIFASWGQVSPHTFILWAVGKTNSSGNLLRGTFTDHNKKYHFEVLIYWFVFIQVYYKLPRVIQLNNLINNK